MIKAVVLHHPQSICLLRKSAFKPVIVSDINISCGTTRSKRAELSEANDFFPSYAAWNSSLFETSVILTVWEHADALIGDSNVAFLHTDVTPHFLPHKIWNKLDRSLTKNPMVPIGLTIPHSMRQIWDGPVISNPASFKPKFDWMFTHDFDNNINVWEYIKKYDNEIYQWALDTQPVMIYSHQFACSRKLFDILGSKLSEITNKLLLRDVGFWTPHLFERLISLYLVKYGSDPILTTYFLHHASSGVMGPGNLSLYGPRPLKHYKTTRR